MTTNLAIVCILTMIIHAAETLSYSIRYAGVKLNKIVVALSLTSMREICGYACGTGDYPAGSPFDRRGGAVDIVHFYTKG